jgi:hypothetical protein
MQRWQASRRVLLLTALTLWVAAAASADAAKVSGEYLGNGKPAQIAHVRVIPHENWQDEKAWTIILSEKDAAKAEKPDFDAMFGELGSALVVSVTASGSIFSVQVCHQALEKSGFSSSGTLSAEGFSIAGGKLSGRFFTSKEEEFFEDRWKVDLVVKDAPLP